jgi:hypothetical protein
MLAIPDHLFVVQNCPQGRHIPAIPNNLFLFIKRLQGQHMPAILDALGSCARYPPETAKYEVLPADPGEAAGVEEAEALVTERRQELFTLFRNIARVAPGEAFSFVARRLQVASAGSSLRPCDACGP